MCQKPICPESGLIRNRSEGPRIFRKCLEGIDCFEGKVHFYFQCLFGQFLLWRLNSGLVVSGDFIEKSIWWASFCSKYDLLGHSLHAFLKLYFLSENSKVTNHVKLPFLQWLLHSTISEFTCGLQIRFWMFDTCTLENMPSKLFLLNAN